MAAAFEQGRVSYSHSPHKTNLVSILPAWILFKVCINLDSRTRLPKFKSCHLLAVGLWPGDITSLILFSHLQNRH